MNNNKFKFYFLCFLGVLLLLIIMINISTNISPELKEKLTTSFSLVGGFSGMAALISKLIKEFYNVHIKNREEHENNGKIASEQKNSILNDSQFKSERVKKLKEFFKEKGL